jgi:hypothetical protein
MGRRPIGNAAMTDAERQKRRRDTMRALPDGAARPRVWVNQSALVQRACTPSSAALELRGDAEAIAARIFQRASVEIARGITMALQQSGSWAPWRAPITS